MTSPVNLPALSARRTFYSEARDQMIVPVSVPELAVLIEALTDERAWLVEQEAEACVCARVYDGPHGVACPALTFANRLARLDAAVTWEAE